MPYSGDGGNSDSINGDSSNGSNGSKNSYEYVPLYTDINSHIHVSLQVVSPGLFQQKWGGVADSHVDEKCNHLYPAEGIPGLHRCHGC